MADLSVRELRTIFLFRIKQSPVGLDDVFYCLFRLFYVILCTHITHIDSHVPVFNNAYFSFFPF